jgi:hypothetical protein
MPELEFSKQQFDVFAGKVSSLQPLTALERELLLAIFAAAAERAKLSAGAGVGTLPLAAIKGEPQGTRGGQPVTAAVLTAQAPTAAVLKQQLLNAYIPGNDFGGLSLPTGKITGDQLTADGG